MRRNAQLPAPLQTAAVAAVANVLLALPAHAEAGKIFDFNLTLPVMVGQFLLLMVFLDKFWFGPVGKVLDERDAKIRSLLGDSKVWALYALCLGASTVALACSCFTSLVASSHGHCRSVNLSRRLGALLLL